jgi:hypothetical protein
MSINDGIKVTDKNFISVLMIGQSNMAGRGELKDVEPIKNPDCYMLRMGRWQPMSEPINVDRAISGIKYCSGVSLAASFADELANFSKKKVGLIPCADGGTASREWLPGESLFDHALMQAQLAKRISDFGGIIWHQGEDDWDTDPKVYKERLKLIMTTLRRELGRENAPVILGELSDKISDDFPFVNVSKSLNPVLYELEKELPFCRVASAKDLELKPDGVHFNSASLRIFGKRYFEKYKEIVEGQK